MNKLTPVLFALSCALCSCGYNIRKSLPVSSGVRTVWNFENPLDPLASSTGPAKLSYYDPAGTGWGPKLTKFAMTSAFGLPLVSGKDKFVMEFPATGPGQGYEVMHNSLPNGVFAWDNYVSNYTLVMDILWPGGNEQSYRSLYHTNQNNSDDGEMFIENRNGGGIGTGGIYNGTIRVNTWHRIAIAVQCALGPGGTGQLHKFIDGKFAGGHYTPGNGPACRWALGPLFLLFADNDNETAKGYVSSIMYVDRFMTMDEIEQLGRISAGGILIHGPGPEPEQRRARKRVAVISHRCNTGDTPENTLTGIRKSFEQGADHIEVDVRLTADSIPVLMHDESVQRTTNGTGLISEMKLSAVKKLDAGSWMGPQYAGENVPTLVEALTAAKGRGRLLLDVKSVGIARSIAQALKEAGVLSSAVWFFQNKNDTAIGDIKNALPDAEILCGDLPDSLSTNEFEKLKKAGVVGFDINYSSATREFVETSHASGMFVCVYTVLDPDTMLRMVDIGVDAMETDFPRVLNSIMPEKKPELFENFPLK